MTALTESQRAMAEALPSMVWTATPEGVVDYVNHVFEDYTGESSLLAAQGEWLRAVHPDDRDHTIEVWMNSIRTGTPYKTEFRIIHKASQGYRWHYVQADPHRGPDGRIVRWYGIATDIHDTKLARKAVDEAHHDLRHLLTLQMLEARVLDRINTEHDLDAILGEITCTVEELLPDGFCSILIFEHDIVQSVHAPKLPPAYGRQLIGLQAAEGVGSCGTAIARQAPCIVSDMRSDPAWTRFPDLVRMLGMQSCWSIPVLDAHGNALASFGIYFRDSRVPAPEDDALLERISHFLRVAIERTRMRLEAKASEARFRAIAQASSDVIWECDLATDAIWFSEGMQRLFGHDPLSDPILQSGSGAAAYIHDEDREHAMAQMRLATRQGRNWQVEYRYRRADGSYASVINRAIVMPNNGVPERVLGSITDITEQKVMEEQLRRSQRLEAVGQLTGGIAHDFNNLLTVILGGADQLAEELEPGSGHQALAETIKAASRRGADLVRSLLSFARQQVLRAKPVHVNVLIAGMQTLLQKAVGTHIALRLNLSTDPHGRPWPVFLDAAQFENSLLNLAINARDAMPAGGTLEIRTRHITLNAEQLGGEVTLDGDHVLVEIQDSGYGMDAETLKRAFDPFYTTKEFGKGNGLGLSMVYGFVQQSNGHIFITSEVELGTTVRLYFPRHAQDVSADVQAPACQVLDRGHERVLIVEDDPTVQQFIATQLKLLGYTTLVADHGQQALDLLRQNPDIDLMLTDMSMPGGLDGLTLAGIARDINPSLRVIISTGYSDQLKPVSDTTTEGYWVLSKPYLRAELATRLRQALSSEATAVTK
jgi:PAS domain S-box-containing protein